MQEHLTLLKQQGLPLPQKKRRPKIVIQNEKKLAAV
jgi:hypothetical protein